MISRGALCRLRYLLIEWHLAHVAPERRATGLALKGALPAILGSACALPPVVLHDDMPLNNAGLAVPGAAEAAAALVVAAQHSGRKHTQKRKSSPGRNVRSKPQ